jgi:hypothetical protein
MDALLSEYTRLCKMQNITDMQAYAMDWRKLMASAQVAGMRNLARNARSRWLHYRQMSGEYVRLFDLPFAELIQVPS